MPKSSSDRLALLNGLSLRPATPAAPPKRERASIPAQKRAHYLPGESRLTCGVSGFQPLDVAAYRRRLYANSEPRNLTPPQFLGSSGGSSSERTTEHVPVGSDPHYPAVWREEKAQLKTDCSSEQYRERFLLSLLTAAYHIWRIPGWTYREDRSAPLTITLF